MRNSIAYLDNISFSYNGLNHIFYNLNLSIKKNLKLGIMGTNGSGKTTLLKIFNALLFPKEGVYFFLDYKIDKKSLKNKEFHLWFRKNCVMLFQNSDFMFFHSSVYDDLAFSLRLLKYPESKIKEKIYYYAKLFKIENKLSENPIFLSGGERKKIALAMIFIQEPQLVLLDEPFNHLDPLYIGHLIEIFHSFNNTLLFTSHNFQLTLEVTKEILILHPKHQILFYGNIDSFFSNEELIKKSELYHNHTHKHKQILQRHRHFPNGKF